MFVDIKKAFDSVAHSFILDLLHSIGMPNCYCKCIAALFHDAYCITTFSTDYFHKIYFDSGVKQGCPLSPLLFLAVMDILDWLLTKFCGCDIRLYADDTAIGCINLSVKVKNIKICIRIFAAFTTSHHTSDPSRMNVPPSLEYCAFVRNLSKLNMMSLAMPLMSISASTGISR